MPAAYSKTRWSSGWGVRPVARINNLAGRDHWPQCYTVLLAGGGVKRGYVHGSSDKIGAFPATDPVRLDDLAATMFYLLGINPHTEVHDALRRPLQISSGYPVMGLLA